MSRLSQIFLSLFFLLVPVLAEGQLIVGPQVNTVKDDIYVTFSVNLEDKNIREIEQGIDKELRLHIDLFKVWEMWPDEFVLGKFFSRTLRVNPIKKEYVATSNDGTVLIEKRFRAFKSMLEWTLSVNDLKLTNIRELETGTYFVKITVESKIRKLPPVIGYLFIFLSENEFKINKKSESFVIEGRP